MFYLDYVGCKVRKRTRLAWMHSRFYLDYVGCKVISLNIICIITIGFISTMWDVKSKWVALFSIVERVLSRLCGM